MGMPAVEPSARMPQGRRKLLRERQEHRAGGGALLPERKAGLVARLRGD